MIKFYFFWGNSYSDRYPRYWFKHGKVMSTEYWKLVTPWFVVGIAK